MVYVQNSEVLSVLGVSVQLNRDVEGDAYVGGSPTIPRAKTGTLSTRTDNDTGVLTLETSHGVTTGEANKIDVYWNGGKRIGMTVGTVSGNSVPIDGGTGDNLPVVDTEITAMVPELIPFSLDGDECLILAANGETRGTIQLFDDDSPAVKQLQIDIESASNGYIWNNESGVTNPIAGDIIVYGLFSHDDGVYARTIRGVAVV